MTENTVMVSLPAGDPVLADYLDGRGLFDAAMAVRGVNPVVYLWRLSQDEDDGYDTYDSCVVAAPDEHSARRIGAHGNTQYDDDRGEWVYASTRKEYGWTAGQRAPGWVSHPDQVKVARIGITTTEKAGTVVCASFNAG